MKRPHRVWMRRGAALVVAGLALAAAGCERPQQQPATATLSEPQTEVDLPIPNLAQQTPVWCWATVAQQVILATKGPQATPSQCALVAAAYELPEQACCSGDPRCMRTGSLGQIQDLIEEYAGRGTTAAGPADASVLHHALASGHAVIMGVNLAPGVGHVVVIRGMSVMPGPQGLTPMVIMNDPMQVYTRPVPFAQVAPYWRQAIIVN